MELTEQKKKKNGTIKTRIKARTKAGSKDRIKAGTKVRTKVRTKAGIRARTKVGTNKKDRITKAMPDETKTRLPEPFETRRSEAMVKDDEQKYQAEVKVKPEQLSMFKDKLLDEDNKDNYRIIGQLFDTYWLIEFEDRFYMMDQHAAHEKVLYERMMKKSGKSILIHR